MKLCHLVQQSPTFPVWGGGGGACKWQAYACSHCSFEQWVHMPSPSTSTLYSCALCSCVRSSALHSWRRSFACPLGHLSCDLVSNGSNGLGTSDLVESRKYACPVKQHVFLCSQLSKFGSEVLQVLLDLKALTPSIGVFKTLFQGSIIKSHNYVR